MVFIRKQQIKGKLYYSLCKWKTIKGKQTLTTIQSYGKEYPYRFKPTIIKGFAEIELKKFPDKSIDLIIIDPPYGIEFDTNHRIIKPKNIGSVSLDSDKIFKILPDVFSECYRILKDNTALYCFARWDTTGKIIEIIEKYFDVKNRLNWIKNNWGMGDLYGSYAPQSEDITFAVKGRHIFNGGRHSDFLKFDRVINSSLFHSHQKPIDLLNFLIEKSSKPKDVVLDCFAGSGSTLISATNLGRKSIGIELEDRYIKVINERLEKECYINIKGLKWI